MTHSSGISVSEELNQSFGDARTSGQIRWLKVQIVEDSLVPTHSHPLGDFEEDFEAIQAQLLPKIPTYVLFRLDTTNINGNEWLFLAYVPDGSPVRERMLYASTRDNLKRQLGYSYFGEDLYGSGKDEFTYRAYVDQKSKKHQDSPLTSSEIQSRLESSSAVDVGHTKEYVHSVKFPTSSEALQKLKELNSPSSSFNLVQLKVDVAKETIELGSVANTTIQDLPSHIPSNVPAFSLYKWSHTHDSENLDSLVFVYSCSDNAPVKLKMLYSTVKTVAIVASEDAGLKLEKKIEITESNEINEALLTELLHPPTEEKKQTFVKPSRPGRGNARLTKK